MKDLIAKLQLDANCALGAIWIHIDAQAARIAELEAQIAAASDQKPEHVAYAENGVLHWMTGRKFQNCELYTAPQAADTDKLREALEVLKAEKTVQEQHYGEVAAAAACGSLLHRGEATCTEGVILGVKYCINHIEEMISASTALQAPVREVPEGWEFNAADFSLKAAGKSNTGHASLIRDLAGRAAWHALDDDGKDSTPLYIYGDGETISAAIADAVKRIPASNKEQA